MFRKTIRAEVFYKTASLVGTYKVVITVSTCSSFTWSERALESSVLNEYSPKNFNFALSMCSLNPVEN